MPSIKARVAAARERLTRAGVPSDEAALDARLLAEHVLGWTTEKYFADASSVPPADFDPQLCTVEPEGLELITDLVRQSSQFAGPIVEIGTLLGITATHMALAKGPRQQIITVDNYCWNPWNLPPDAQYALAHQTLYYLIQTGQVEHLRMDKARFYATYAGPPPALVFLDAWHTYEETKKDIEWARAVGARLIAGHDYSAQFPGVMQVVNEFGGPCTLAGSVWLLHSQPAAIAGRAA